MNYLEHGLAFEKLNTEVSIEDYIKVCFPKDSIRLLSYLPPLQTLQFLKSYFEFRQDLRRKFAKDGVYSVVLLGIGMMLSYFYIYQFEPSIRSLLIEYDTNITVLNRYSLILKALMSLLNIFFMGCVMILFLLQSKDLKMMFNVVLLSHNQFYKKIISYQYTMMLLLFMKFDMKTSDMVSFLRHASIGDTNKWLSYHVETQLGNGTMIHQCFEERYFDPHLIEFIALGYHHQDIASYLTKYCSMSSKNLDIRIKHITKVFKGLVFIYLVIIVAIFYSTLYLPLQLLEVI